MVDPHVRLAYAPERFVEAAERAERAAPHAPSPEQLREHDGQKRPYARGRSEEDAFVHGADGGEGFEHRHARQRREREHAKRDPQLRMARHGSLAHLDAELAPQGVHTFEQQVHGTDPTAERASPHKPVHREHRQRGEEPLGLERLRGGDGLEHRERIEHLRAEDRGGGEAAEERQVGRRGQCVVRAGADAEKPPARHDERRGEQDEGACLHDAPRDGPAPGAPLRRLAHRAPSG